MSKKCCGIIYSQNEKFCTKCGKPLVEVPDEETPIVLDMAEVDKIAASVLGEAEKSGEQESDKTEHETTESVESAEQLKEQAESIKEQDTKETKEAGKDQKSDTEDEDDDEDDEEDDGKASPALKFFGTLMILLMLASLVAVGLGIYFVKLNPFYKDHNINEPVVYEGVATDTDVNNVELSSLLTPVSIEVQTPTDAEVEVSTLTDATTTDAVDDESSDSEESSESEE